MDYRCDSFVFQWFMFEYAGFVFAFQALCPLANTALIDYTLEWLSRTEVKTVHVVSCRDSDAVKKYLDRYCRIRLQQMLMLTCNLQ